MMQDKKMREKLHSTASSDIFFSRLNSFIYIFVANQSESSTPTILY